MAASSFPIDPVAFGREPEPRHSRAMIHHRLLGLLPNWCCRGSGPGLAHPAASEVAADDLRRSAIDFASLGESADLAGVLSFSPIVLSQYLLKPFLNLLLTF